VHGFYISGLECEGYGFSVLNCAPFYLAPNATRKIDIAFTPDFTLSRVTRTLRLATTVGRDVNYTMVTTLPPNFLASCAAVLARPSWEPLLYYSSVSFMLFLLFCVMAAAFFESDRILKCALLTLTRDRTGIAFDLRQIGASAIKELKKRDSESDSLDTYSMKDSSPESETAPGWITQGCADDRQFDPPPKNPPTPSKEEPDKPVKVKKKLAKRNSDADNQEVAAITKKKEKHTANGWCVFMRAGDEKTKTKSPPPEPESPETVKIEKEKPVEPKKDKEKDRRRWKPKRFSYSKEREEEAVSNSTDSSNNNEEEVKEPKDVKDEKRKVAKPKLKEDSVEEKTMASRTIWRMPNRQTGKLTHIEQKKRTDPEPEGETLRTIEISKSRGKNNNVKDKNSKGVLKLLADNFGRFYFMI